LLSFFFYYLNFFVPAFKVYSVQVTYITCLHPAVKHIIIESNINVEQVKISCWS